jgi:hypothetical protein
VGRARRRLTLLSVLDQTPVPEGTTRPDALRNTLDLAQLADRLGSGGVMVLVQGRRELQPARRPVPGRQLS